MSRHRNLAAALLLGAVLWAAGPAAAQTTVEWTVLVYLNGDTAAGYPNLTNAAITHINCLEQVGSNANVNLIVQWDRTAGTDNLKTYYGGDPTQNWSEARRYYITNDQNQVVGGDPYALEPGAAAPPAGYRLNSPLLLSLGEVDMGSEDTLVEFCRWSFQKFPARHYLLILDDTGRGWQPRSGGKASKGVIFDPNPGNGGAATYLSNVQLRSALTRIKALQGKNLDALIFDAGGMGNLETVYQCRDLADYVVGTWLERPTGGYPYHKWLDPLVKQPPTTTDGLEAWLKQAAADYNGNYQATTTAPGGAQSTAIACYRMNQLESVKKAADNLAKALLTDLPAYAPGVMRVLSKVQYGNPYDFSGQYLDLLHFATLCSQEISDAKVTTPAGAVSAALTAALVNTSLANTVAGSLSVSNYNGASLYFPRVIDYLDANYGSSGDFVTDTQWDELVQGVLTLNTDTHGPQISISSPLAGASIIENPPTIVASLVDTDLGGKVNASSIQLMVDSTVIASSAYTFDATSGLLTYVPPSPLSVTSHTVTVSAKDLSGNSSTASTSFRIAVPTIPIGVQTFSLPRLVTKTTADPALVFGANNYTLVRWVPTLYGTSKYRTYPDLLASLLPTDAGSTLNSPTVANPPAGLGYWVRVLASRPLASLPGSAVTSAEYAIRLYHNPDGGAGWNMVGVPYDVAAVGLASTQVLRTDGRRITFQQAIDQQILPGTIYTYVQNPANPSASGSYTFETGGIGSLLRLQGHWLKVNQDCTLIITSSSRQAQAPVRREREEAAGAGWQVALKADAGQAGSDQVVLGVSRAATAGYDARSDVEAPPTLPDGCELRVVHRDWGAANGRYLQDYVGVGDRWVWDVDVRAPSGPVVLSWPSLRSLPGEADLVLTDLTTGQTRRLRNCAGYRFQHTGGTRAFRVTGSATGSGAVGLDGVTVTTGRGSGLTVGYTLARAADVVLVVRSLSGRTLRITPATSGSVGRGQLYWDGRAADGSPLPNGVYQLEVVATAGDGATARQIRTVRVAH